MLRDFEFYFIFPKEKSFVTKVVEKDKKFTYNGVYVILCRVLYNFQSFCLASDVLKLYYSYYDYK